jgi:hypothetical protein
LHIRQCNLTNLLDEFFGIVKDLNAAGIRCAVVGGVAMALHDQPRFTEP